MGLHDRPYWQEDAPRRRQYPGGGGGFALGLPRPGRVVKWLLILNISMFVVQLIFRFALKVSLADYLGATVGAYWQVWRYVTFQFLHDSSSLWHLGLNLLGLYMFGTPLEQRWGQRRFLEFYLSCGVTAGVAYVVMGSLLGLPRMIPLIGASGGVFGVLLACAVLFPHFRVILFIFPVPIRLAAVLIFGGMILVVLSSLSGQQVSPMFWSHVAHLGGTVAAAVWLWALPRVKLRPRGGPGLASRLRRGAWRRRMERRRRRQEQIDRILEKIHREGINALSRQEKRLLHEATREQRHEDRELYRL